MSDMKNRKVSASKRRARQRKQRNRRIALTLCLMLVVCVASIGGTLAWLTSTTAPVVNTFTPSDINITLTETTGETYKMVPGATIAKDPKVTVVAGSEPCWLFVKVEKENNFDNFMTYEMADGWMLVPNQTNVYYRQVNASDTNKEFGVLANNQVTVKNTVTKADMEAIKAANQPTLTFTAYAIQQEGFTTAEAAWVEASK